MRQTTASNLELECNKADTLQIQARVQTAGSDPRMAPKSARLIFGNHTAPSLRAVFDKPVSDVHVESGISEEQLCE
jgi:hypothetical protein